MSKAEKFLGVENLYVSEHGTLVNHLIQSLKAESLFQRDNDYAVIDGEVKIIDEFTGRILEGRRWSEGLHQAVEAKEGVSDPRGEPDARDDHAPELLPPLRQAHRDDRHRAHRGDRVHEDLRDAGGRDPDQPADGPRRPQRPDLQDQGRQVEGGRRARSPSATSSGQPILVGTISVEVSEMLSERAQPRTGSSTSSSTRSPSTPQREGETSPRRAAIGAVTIATNMAGRGVDIKLGGDPEQLAASRAAQARRHARRTRARSRSSPS